MNARLGPLQDNGGVTFTHSLLPDSPAIDKAGPGGLATDQRGAARPFDYAAIPNASGGNGADIGAFESAEVIVVTTTTDEDNGSTNPALGSGTSLREAINFAKQNLNLPWTITLNLPGAGVHVLNLSSIGDNDATGASAFLLNANLSLQGPGANLLTIRRGSGGDYRIFRVPSGVTVAISGLTIDNGNLPSGVGGGVFNQGTLTLRACAVTNNSGNDAGGIRTEGSLTLDRCTVSGNSSFSGAGISSQTNLSGLTTVIRNSTISGNTAGNFGGGLDNVTGLTQITNSTITRNTAPEGNGGGVFSHFASNTRTEVYDTIIAGNIDSDVDAVPGATPYLSSGYNLIGFGSGAGAFTAQGDTKFVATPQLGLLADNGGGTNTHALLLGSPAIDNGATASVATDQRGLARRSGSVVDIGAYELQPEPFGAATFFRLTLPLTYLRPMPMRTATAF